MSELIKYLNEFDTPEQAIEGITFELGVKVKEYDTGFCVFNYSQIDSPKTHPVVRESRGAILKFNDGWEYYCRPFLRFYNYGEAPDTLNDFKWARTMAYEKADGSLIKVWFDGEDWQVGTRGTAYAESENYTGRIFKDMVLEAFGLSEEKFQEESTILSSDCTFLYEFTSPDNRIVTPYSESRMVLLGVVKNISGGIHSSPDEIVLIGNSRFANTFELIDGDACVEAAKHLKDLEEGYVVRDIFSGQMVKIKSPLYVKAHHVRGNEGLTPKKTIGLVITNESAEYLKYFPDDTEKVELVAHHWGVIKTFIEMEWDKAKIILDQKEFAMAVKDLPYSAVLFRAKKNQENPIRCLNDCAEKYRIDLLTNWIEAGKIKKPDEA